MSGQTILIQPGPIFWEVFRGAMTAHGIGVTKLGRRARLGCCQHEADGDGCHEWPKIKENQAVDD